MTTLLLDGQPADTCCPSTASGPECAAVEVFAQKWSVCVLYTLQRLGGTLRFRAIQRALRPSGGHVVSARMLAITLRALEAAQLVTRTTYEVSPPRVDYALTPKACTVLQTLEALHAQLGAGCHDAETTSPS
ncbi:MAG TPA: helix-turn-helix domain-containing protein [Candidatus Dormibacteraeota bacterium]|nr:helix-turn-helix domain-containing protein [Candidatus Dormibacteraeota bacterium]